MERVDQLQSPPPNARSNDELATANGSRFLALSQRRALAIATAFVVVCGWFVYCVAGPTPARLQNHTALATPGHSDSALYEAIIARVRGGQNYYDATGAELRARDYPTRPVFNWREPTYAFVLARLPWPSAWLVALALTTIVLSFVWLRGAFSERAALAVVALHAGALPFGADAVVFQEVWAGSFIILSATLYARDRWPLGFLALLVALAFREHALLPCGVAFLLALHARRSAEAVAWIVAVAAWTGLMALHFHVVAQHLGPADFTAPSRSWLVFGGPRFLVSMLSFDAYGLLLPRVIAAFVIPCALLGYAGWRNPGATRMGWTLLGFMLAFCIVGKPFDTYWGSLWVPLLSVGLVRFPFALRDLSRALRRPS